MSALASVSSQFPVTLPDHLQEHLHTARQLAEQHAERSPVVRSTGVPPLDRLLSGGLHHGRLVEIVGRRSCGRFSIVLATLAATTARGEAAALVDLGNALDPQNAAAAGISLDRLLWIRPTHMKPALIAAEAVLGAGFPLVVFDLGLPPVPGGRGAEPPWLRLARAADVQRSTLLVTAPYRVSGTAATAVLSAADARPDWIGRGAAPRLLCGTQGRLRIEKLRRHVLGDSEAFEFIAAESRSALSATQVDIRHGGSRRDGIRHDDSASRRPLADVG